jgi:solute carrier family 25 carnitine/acylcarnitine transporter 20/29
MESFVKDIFPGSVAGLAQTIVGHPLDSIKVKYVNSNAKTIYECMRIMYRDNGLRAFYQGIKSPLCGGLLYNTSVFYGYNFTTEKLGWNPFVAGSVVGSCATVVESPMDMIKTRMQLDKRVSFGSSLHMPLSQLLKGFNVTLLRNIPSCGLYFGTFEYSQSHMTSYPIAGSVLSGALAGGACWGLSYPLDNIKTRIQADYANKKYSGAMDCFRKTPFRSLWSGFIPCMARAVPVNSAVFFGYTLVSNKM